MDEILSRAWNPTLGSLVATYGGDTLDASLLQCITLRLLPASDPRMRTTLQAIQQQLTTPVGHWLRRYAHDDGFGIPSSAFLICTFWKIEAMARCGQIEAARAAMTDALRALSPLGLLSEDLDPETGRLFGNFPQAYSHVGLIHAAFASAPSWTEIV
ncbi:MAG: glycoside hydrolase family 15 protein [Ferruginibacter sp.]